MRCALEGGHVAFGELAAQRKIRRVVAEIGRLIAEDLGVAGDKAAVGCQRQRVDFEKSEILLPSNIGEPRRITGEAGGYSARKQGRRSGVDLLRHGRRRQFERHASKVCCALDVAAAVRRQQQFQPLGRAVDADGDENFARNRHRLFEKERGVGIVERRQDQPPRLAQLGDVLQSPHQAAFAAPAGEDLRLEEESSPIRRFVGRPIAGMKQYAARDRQAVAA